MEIPKLFRRFKHFDVFTQAYIAIVLFTLLEDMEKEGELPPRVIKILEKVIAIEEEK